MEGKTPQNLWNAALGELQLQITRANYETWLKDTAGLSFEGDLFIVGAPTAFATEWLEKRLSSLVKKTLSGIAGHEVDVKFVVHQVQRGEMPGAMPLSQNQRDGKDSSRPPFHKGEGSRMAGSPLNVKYTFTSFVVGSSNQLAHAAALRVAQEPGQSYNPLFIYGGVGLGKTHLLHAVGHFCLSNSLNVLYITSEQFTNEFIDAIRVGKDEEFRAKYRNTDILLVDDIQFIADKERTQESFFNTFNDLHNANHQIVVSSDRPPHSMPTMEDRLRSRFEWGLMVDIQPPDFETRVAILLAKAEEQGVNVPSQVLELTAQRFPRDIREMEGALNRILAFGNMKKTTISLDLAQQALVDISPTSRRRSISPEGIVNAVSQYYKISFDDLRGPKRVKEIALARQIAMYLLREETRLSLKNIGQELGGRDHSTVIHGHEKVTTEMKNNPQLRRAVQEIRRILREEGT